MSLCVSIVFPVIAVTLLVILVVFYCVRVPWFNDSTVGRHPVVSSFELLGIRLL